MSTDDDDLDASTSTSAAFTRADHGRQQRREMILGKGIDPVTNSKLSGLKGRVNLKIETAKAGDDHTKNTLPASAKQTEVKGVKGGTKTREQEIQADTLTANAKLPTDQLVKDQNRSEKAKDDRVKAGETQRQPA